jgi:DNA-binding NtrC family response regulator
MNLKREILSDILSYIPDNVSIRDLELAYVSEILQRHEGLRMESAANLGIAQRTLRQYIQKLKDQKLPAPKPVRRGRRPQ